jgi:hypothetical protein
MTAAQKVFNALHPEIRRDRDKAYRAKNPDKVVEYYTRHSRKPKTKARLMANWMKHKYGLSEEGYQELWDRQSGLCAICGKSEEVTRRLHVDHCHDTKIIRGLLCGKCNRGIGMFDDSEELLNSAIAYLRLSTALAP